MVRTCEERLFECYGVADHLMYHVFVHRLVEFVIESACEVHVQAFVTHYQLVRVAQTRHKAARPDPENGRERRGEEDAFDDGERDNPSTEGIRGAVEPLEAPISFPFDRWDGVDGAE